MQELLTLYALEGFLGRLGRSGLSADLVLKGGVLLAAYAVRRPTRDVDVAARAHSNEPDEVLELVSHIAMLAGDDGVEFDLSDAGAATIRDRDQYSGVRVTLDFRLATARGRFHVDVNFGDPISPAPQEISLPRLLGGEIRLQGYPLQMVLAEKLTTGLSLGTVSTRWRDYGDIYALTRRHEVDGDDLQTALHVVSAHRGVRLRALSVALEGYGPLGQIAYAKWVRKHQMQDWLPDDFTAVVAEVTAFADAPLTAGTAGAVWSPSRLAWEQQGP